MKPTTLYVVTEGCYSAYHIVGVFDDRQVAEDLATRLGDDTDVEEFPLNPGLERYHAGRSVWRVEMGRDGTVLRIEDHGWLSQNTAESLFDRWYDRPALTLVKHVWATDKAHAIKIVNERRTELVATGAWDTELARQAQERDARRGITTTFEDALARLIPLDTPPPPVV